MQEPLDYFFNNLKYDKSQISEIIPGARYLAVQNNKGQIGVCATLGNIFNIDEEMLNNPSLQNNDHRIFLTAYYNSILNYQQQNLIQGDLIDVIDFKKYKRITMIGYFRPIVEKMDKLDIKLNIFDLRDQEISLPIEDQKKYLQNCDAAIFTATSISNNTFEKIAENCNGEIFILGPSSIMNEYFFCYKNVKAIFGSTYNLYDTEVLNIIREGLGTRHFLKLGQKKVLMNQHI